jgi:hypothetical protein
LCRDRCCPAPARPCIGYPPYDYPYADLHPRTFTNRFPHPAASADPDAQPDPQHLPDSDGYAYLHPDPHRNAYPDGDSYTYPYPDAFRSPAYRYTYPGTSDSDRDYWSARAFSYQLTPPSRHSHA